MLTKLTHFIIQINPPKGVLHIGHNVNEFKGSVQTNFGCQRCHSKSFSGRRSSDNYKGLSDTKFNKTNRVKHIILGHDLNVDFEEARQLTIKNFFVYRFLE